MMLPPMRYKADNRETVVYFKAVANSTDLPIMVYNNPVDYGIEVSLDMFEELLKHEIFVSESINKLVDIALQEKDYATHNFLQWYVSEQIEEERLARTCNDKLEMIGDDKSGLYLFDRDILSLAQEGETEN